MEKVYAVVAKGDKVMGDVRGEFEQGQVAFAGAVTIDGSPVNKFGVSLSLQKRHLDAAIDLPRLRRMEHTVGENTHVFITHQADQDDDV